MTPFPPPPFPRKAATTVQPLAGFRMGVNPFPPSPFPGKGVTTVQPLAGFRMGELLPICGGLKEAL